MTSGSRTLGLVTRSIGFDQTSYFDYTCFYKTEVASTLLVEADPVRTSGRREERVLLRLNHELEH